MDFSKLNVGENMNPTIYKDRVLQEDADFLCYFVADLDKPLQSNVNHLIKMIDTNRRMVGAEFVNAHLTLGSKGGRHEIATVKPYQKDRKDSDVKVRVREIRQEMANWAGNDKITVIANLIVEADDSISMFHKAYNDSGKGVSIISSGDKDLNMNSGVHRDSHSGKLLKVNGFGNTQYKEVGNTKPKLIGYGTSWFWHQLLMGDTADNIPGLEKVAGSTLNEYFPLKKFNPNRSNQPCGEKKAVAILEGVNSDFNACRRVVDAYRAYYGDSYIERIVEQAFLLWMRRDNNEWDVIEFFKEIGWEELVPTEEQLQKVANWKQMMVGIHGKEWFE